MANYNDKKTFNKRESRYTYAEFYLSDDIPEDIKSSILSVIDQTKFSKLSYPLAAYKGKFIKVDEDKDRATTIGYIVDYNPETFVFKLIIFSNNKYMLEGFDKFIITPDYVTTKEGKLRTITKLLLSPEINEKSVKVVDSNEIDLVVD